MAIDTLSLTIIGSVILAVLSFFLNGWRERTFERKKVNYLQKIKIFNEVIRELYQMKLIILMVNSYYQIRALSSAEDNSDYLSRIIRYIQCSSLPDSLRPNNMLLRNIEEIIDSKSFRPGVSEEEKGEKRIFNQQWQILLELSDIIIDAYQFHFDHLSNINDKAFLIAETDEVTQGIINVSDFSRRIIWDQTDISNMYWDTDSLYPYQTDIYKEFDDYKMTLLYAMNSELEITMRSWIGQKIYLRTIERRVKKKKP